MPGHPPEGPQTPYPLPPAPERPNPVEILAMPVVDGVGGLLRDQLAAQRRILVSGPLDLETVTGLSAQLMAFDGASSRDVEIVINSAGGPMAEIFAVLDVLGLMRARTNVTVIGLAAGTAVALVAGGNGERRAAPHASLSLRCGDEQRIEGTTGDIVRQAEEMTNLRGRYLRALAKATGQDEQFLAVEIDRGAQRTATEAKELGILDSILPARGHQSRS